MLKIIVIVGFILGTACTKPDLVGPPTTPSNSDCCQCLSELQRLKVHTHQCVKNLELGGIIEAYVGCKSVCGAKCSHLTQSE